MLRQIFFIMLFGLNAQAFDQRIDERALTAPTASTVGNLALWHNPAGLAFMGGTEVNMNYLYEWSDLGSRHHFLGNLALNLAHMFTLGLGVKTKAAISEESRSQLGTELSGMIGAAFRMDRTSIGLSVYKSHNFLAHKTTAFLYSFGLQTRPWSFLSLGAHYTQVHAPFFSAPNITLGLSVRPYKEYLTLSIDSRFRGLGLHWQNGFRTEPIFNIKGEFGGYAIALGAEIPGVANGWSKPIFSVNLEANLAHLGLNLSTMINPHGKNYAVGASIRASSDMWPAIASPKGLFVKLTIDPDGTIERPSANFLQKFFSEPESPLSVLALLRRIESDPSIRGVLLEFNGFSFGNGRTEEWRDAIINLRKADKSVIVYLDAPSERDYYIASAATRILMNRQETISFSGFQATLVYYAKMLELIGIKAEAIAAGSYKTAPRKWTEAKPQKEEIEVLSNILNSFYQRMLKDVELARGIDQAKLKSLFNEGQISATLAKEAGLVDEIIEAGVAADWVNHMEGPASFYANYDSQKFKQVSWGCPKKIAVIPVTDTIEDGRSHPGLLSLISKATGAKDVIYEIDRAVKDPEVIGIIVRIDSPGGDAEAGHKIQKALLRAQRFKPIIASMSDMAASAGYLIASGANQILALPDTITGSIGVFSLMFSGEKLAEKLKVNNKELSPIKNPGPTLWRDLSSGEKKQAQKIVDWYYQNFIDAVSFGLKMNRREVLENANGHVWLGQEALEKKLVHELGGFMRAVDILLELTNTTQKEVILDVRSSIKEQFPLNAALLGYLGAGSSNLKSSLISPYLKAIEAYHLNQGPKARLPFDIEWPGKNRR